MACQIQAGEPRHACELLKQMLIAQLVVAQIHSMKLGEESEVLASGDQGTPHMALWARGDERKLESRIVKLNWFKK